MRQNIAGSFVLLFVILVSAASQSREQNNLAETNAQALANVAVNDFRLIPGERAGLLKLGQKSREVLGLMGKPTELSQRSQGIEEIIWFQGENETKVILAADAVIQIEVTHPKYRDVLGNGVTSPLNAIFARYRAKGYELPKRAIYDVFIQDEGGYEANVYDDIESGIAYHVGTQDIFDLSTPPDRLIIHRAGKPAMAPKYSTPISLAAKAAQEKAINTPSAPRKLWKNTSAIGNGWPLTEVVTDDSARGVTTSPVILPGRIAFHASALTQTSSGLWHPLIFFRVAAYNDRPVWQDVSQVTFSWGYRRLSIAAEKQTQSEPSENGIPVFRTQLSLRFPFRDFLEMAAAGKFTMIVGSAAFAVEKPQTLGLRALARVCGAQNVSLDSGQTSNNLARPGNLARLPNRRPVKPFNEFFPQTSRRRLSQKEVRAMNDGDLRLAINEMFARHGLSFKDKSLQARFESLGWYRARDERTYAVISARMSAIERANLDLLATERKRR